MDVVHRVGAGLGGTTLMAAAVDTTSRTTRGLHEAPALPREGPSGGGPYGRAQLDKAQIIPAHTRAAAGPVGAAVWAGEQPAKAERR